MESKVCSKCKELLSIDNFGTKKRKLKNNIIKIDIRCSCRKCNNIYHSNYFKKNKKEFYIKRNIYYHKNKELVLKLNKKWRLENIDKFKESQKKWRANNPQKVKKIQKKQDINAVIELSNTYVINKITRDSTLNTSIIKQYPELIEAKRLQILTKRLCRTSQN